MLKISTQNPALDSYAIFCITRENIHLQTVNLSKYLYVHFHLLHHCTVEGLNIIQF